MKQTRSVTCYAGGESCFVLRERWAAKVAVTTQLVLALLVFVLAGCAAMPRSEYFEEQDTPVTATAAGRARVYFYREKKFLGSGVSYYINDGEQRIGGLKSGVYFVHDTTPGTHTFCAETEAEVCKTIELEANESYYIRGDVDFGFWIGRPSLTIVSEMEGKATVPHLQRAELLSEEEMEAIDSRENSSF